MNKVVTSDALRSAFNRALQLVDFYGGSIDLSSRDLYWKVSSDTAYDMSKEPAYSVGSLDDDLDSIRKLILDEERPVTSVDLDRVAAILNAIAEAINPAA
jgi:hypothetical protein